MQTLFKFVVLIVGGLLVLSGCASSDVSPSTQVERITEASPTPKQMTESEVEEAQSQSQEVADSGYVFYDSYADW